MLKIIIVHEFIAKSPKTYEIIVDDKIYNPNEIDEIIEILKNYEI